MQGRLAFCIRASVLSLALFACSTDEPTSPEDPEDPEVPEIPSTLRWSDGSSWPGGQVPAAGAAVVIPTGRAILLDVSPPPLASLNVEGALVFDEQDIDLTAGHILVQGTMRVGTSAQPFQHRATITLTGAASDGNVMGMGNRVLGVAGGTLDLHGESRLGWTRLAATASAGSSQLLLEGTPAWRAGDRVVVASTDFDPNHAEVATVAGVSGQSVSLEGPLAFTHYGEVQTIAGHSVDERAEVGLLTRNVQVRGDSATSQEAGYGGHIMGTGGTLRVSGVMLRFMGQKGLVARYPMHWHVMGAVDGQYFAGNSVWGSFNRCVTVHGSDNARVENNVCYDHLGHGYFLEDGAETGNLVAGNLGLGTKSTGEGVLPTDDRAATFWITNPDNTIRGNVAAGSTGFGFWYALPAAPTGLSTGQPELPRNTPLREFSNNVAHTNRRGGLHVDDGPRAGRHDRDHLLRAAHRSRRREHGRGRRLHPVHGLQAPRPGGLAQGTRPPLEQQRCWRTTPSAPPSPRARRSSRTRSSWASRPTMRARCSTTLPAGDTSSTTAGWAPTGSPSPTTPRWRPFRRAPSGSIATTDSR